MRYGVRTYVCSYIRNAGRGTKTMWHQYADALTKA